MGNTVSKEKSLYYVEENKDYIVDSVPKASLLPSLGIYPKSIIRKNYTYGFGGPVVLNVGSREIAIGKDIAENILVSEVK